MCITLIQVCAREQARRSYRLMGSRSEGEARGYFVGALRRHVGVSVAREFARHRLRRLALVGVSRAAIAEARRIRLVAGGSAPGDARGWASMEDFFAFQAAQSHGAGGALRVD